MTSVFFNCAAPAAAIVEHSAFFAIAADGMLFGRRFVLAHWRYIFRFDFQSVGKSAEVCRYISFCRFDKKDLEETLRLVRIKLEIKKETEGKKS